jgi:GGDEF domain-containing protein
MSGMVYRDALTAVADRMRWDELLDDRRGAGALGCLATVDVDRFKAINDTHGHVAGDRALQALAAELHPYGANVPIGVSRIHQGQHALRDSYLNADSALYLARGHGGASVRFSN